MGDTVTNLIILSVMGAGMVAGGLGALLGLGGGVFLMPFLTLALGLPFKTAVGISLTTVIATSSAVSARTAGRQLINLRLGMLLEVATATGGLLGGLTARTLSNQTLQGLFGVVTAGIAVLMLTRLDRRNVILDPAAEPGWLGGRYHDRESGCGVCYRVRRLPLALGVSLIAGNLSTLLGIGGGILKVPALDAWCGVPLRAAAATSAFMLGVTAVSAVPILYARGEVIPHFAAAAVIGVLVGSKAGLWFGGRARLRWLRLLMAGILLAVSAMMFARVR